MPHNPKDPHKLNRRQRAFVEGIKLGEGAPHEVYVAAGFTPKDIYTAKQSAGILLKNPKVVAALAATRRAHVLKHEVNRDLIIHRLSVLSEIDITQVFNADGRLKPVSEWPEGASYCVKKMEFDAAGNVTKLEFVDKLRPLELMGKHIGMFADKAAFVDFDPDELVRKLQAGRERVALMHPDSVSNAEIVETDEDGDTCD